MWRRVDLVWTYVSEERVASIFKVEKSASKEPAWTGGYPEDGGDTFLRNVGSRKIYTAPHSRRQHSSITALFEDVCLWGYNAVWSVESTDDPEEHIASIFRVE
jgi:hypothetical protein